MDKIYEHIVTTYNTSFYKDNNSLDPINIALFGDDDLSFTAKSLGTEKHPHFEYDNKKCPLNDEESFVENYANPLCSVETTRRIVCVEKNDEKVSLKLFYYVRARRVGKPYFVKSTALHFITYNYKTNSLYTGSLINYHLKRKCRKSLRRVSLAENLIENFQGKIKGFFNNSFFNGTVVMDKYDTSIPIKKFVDAIPDVKEFDPEPKYTLYKHILTSGGIKLPNNWKQLIEVYPQPKKRHYKKVGFKYVDAFMAIRNMSGDKLKRVLHTVSRFNVTTYDWSFKLFGGDFMLSLPDSELKLIMECVVEAHHIITPEELGLTKSELKNIYNIFKEVCVGNIDFTTLMDHFHFKSKLLKYQTVKWKSKTLNEFIDEHDEWSKLILSYTKGTTTRRYGREFVGSVEIPITVNGEIYYPKVLTNSDEYNNESTVQTNCVRTYVDRPDCFIVSLRKGELNSLERLTNEYALTVVDDELKITRVQTKAKRNSEPDISWLDALLILDGKVNDLHKRKLFRLPQKDVEFKLGLGKHAEAIIYKYDNYSTIIWDEKLAEMGLHGSMSNYQFEFDDLP